MKTIAFAFAAAMCLTAAPVLADEAAELTTAQTHAGLAAKAGDIKMVQMHLHHSLNCLVGASGAGFDASNANPCAKAGSGAIPDSTDAGQKAKLQTAVAQLQDGIATTDLAAAQKAGTDAAATIGTAK